jgi:acetyl esterase/lipase
VNSAFAAGSPGVERNTQGFPDALAAGGGKPLETLAPKDARAVLSTAQAGVKVDVSGIRVERRTIQADGQPLQIRVVRPEGATGELPVFMFFHGGGGCWAITPPTNA